MSSGSTKVILIAMLANLGIAIAKFVGAYISKSSALLAEAIHSVVDTTNQVLLLLGEKASKKNRTTHILWDTVAKPFSGRLS